MARPAGPGRTALLDAGRRLVADDSNGTTLGTLSVNAVVAEAGMSKGAFFQHFPARRDFVLELHRSYHDELGNRIGRAIAGLDPGEERLERGISTYLDACLETRSTKTMLFDARADADLGPEVARRNAQFAEVAADDLAAVGWSDPPSIARLVVAAVAEVALVEAASGRRDRRLRAAVLALVRGADR